jgi:putative aldouronate transport system substrate-binding protein
MDALKAAPVSPYLGFTPDMAELANQIAAITAVNDTYTPRIYTGAFSGTDYAEYIAALKTAGVEEYLAEIQKQLDAWIAANK